MNVFPTSLPEVLVIEPKVHGDTRGFFLESYNERVFRELVSTDCRFVQDNHSRSMRGVLRGLHYQLPPHAQGKLVRVVSGRVFDVAVDVRRGSARFGRWAGIELDVEHQRQLWVPPGFAHGFLVLSDSADLLYKTTEYYVPDAERVIRWNDPQIGIAWPTVEGVDLIMSTRDSSAESLLHTELPELR